MVLERMLWLKSIFQWLTIQFVSNWTVAVWYTWRLSPTFFSPIDGVYNLKPRGTLENRLLLKVYSGQFGACVKWSQINLFKETLHSYVKFES